MLASELKSIIKGCENVDCWGDVAHEACGNCAGINRGKYKSKLVSELDGKGYILESVDGYGGEGSGDNYWGVFSVTDNGSKTYFRIKGWYASYDGCDIDVWDFKVVKKVPVQTFEWVEA